MLPKELVSRRSPICTIDSSINNKTTCPEPEKLKLPVPSQSAVWLCKPRDTRKIDDPGQLYVF